MINISSCRGCGRPLFIHRVAANMDVRLETDRLDGPAATGALIAGRGLWRLTVTSCTPAKPGVLSALVTADPGERPHVVQEHRCTGNAQTALQAPRKASVVAEEAACPKVREEAAQTAARARSAEPVTRRRSSDPVCEACGVRIANGDQMVGIQLGELYVYAQHAANCL